MEIFNNLIAIITGVSLLGGIIAVIIKTVLAFANGQKVLLRAQMLKTYYKYKELGEVPEYELMNYWHAYDSYKALGGNSFIDDITEEVKAWGATR